jgi:DNA-directed RNA polymerase subunit M/transcription elongation factor TFIIS
MPPSKSKKDYSTLLLSQRGDVEPLTISGPASGLTDQAIQAHFKKTQKVLPVGSYSYKSFTLFLFGSLDGTDGTENQHQMPTPYDTTVFYQDLLIVVSKDENSFVNPVPFTMEEYEGFYTKSFGGYMSDEDAEEENEIVEEAEPDAAMEDGKDFPVEEEEEDDDEEEEEEEEEEAEAVADDGEQAPTPKVRAPKKKRAVTKNMTSSILAGTSTAYPDKPILSEADQLQEESEPSAIAELTAPTRQHVHAALQKLFADDLTELQILQLETSIYNGAIKRAKAQRLVRSWTFPLFAHMYKMHAKQISSNFSNKSYVGNTELFDRFKGGEIQIQDLSKMDQYELNPSRWKAQFDNQQMREKRQLEGNRSMATDIFQCNRCHKRECTYYEMQTRSADEPMTIFITCLNCGKHWRQ